VLYFPFPEVSPSRSGAAEVRRQMASPTAETLESQSLRRFFQKSPISLKRSQNFFNNDLIIEKSSCVRTSALGRLGLLSPTQTTQEMPSWLIF
jgi:hypothetical protein